MRARKQEIRRTEDIWNEVKKFSEKENIHASKVLGLLLTRCEDVNMKKIGRKIMDGEDEAEKEIPVVTALTIYCDCNLGRETCTKQRRLLKEAGFPIFPSWGKVRALQSEITPEVKTLLAPYQGVYFPFLKAVQQTTVRIMEYGNFEVESPLLQMKIKYGFDGSGSHAIYNQKNNAETNNMVLSMFCPLDIKVQNGEVVWEEPAPNSPLSQRPLILQMGKESHENLEAQAIFNEDIRIMTDDGFAVNNKTLKADMHMMFDRKAADSYLGCTGAYCDLCTHSKEVCVQKVKHRETFVIDRDVQTMHQIFDDLEVDGVIQRSTGDYAVRQGQIHKPIPLHNVQSTQVLHGLLRSFDHFMKALVHVKAGVFHWSEVKGSYNKLFIDNSKDELRKSLEETLHVKWDQPDPAGKGGTTTTGNTARILLHKKRNAAINELPDELQSKFRKWGQHLSVILRVISSKSQVDVR